MVGLERSLTRQIAERLRKVPGVWVYKTIGTVYSRAGVPDLLICAEGHFVALEVKRATGRSKATKLQMHELAAIALAGGRSRIVRSVGEAIAVIDEAIAAGRSA